MTCIDEKHTVCRVIFVLKVTYNLFETSHSNLQEFRETAMLRWVLSRQVMRNVRRN